MFAFEISQLGCTILYVPQPSNISEHRSHIRAESVCVGGGIGDCKMGVAGVGTD